MFFSFRRAALKFAVFAFFFCNCECICGYQCGKVGNENESENVDKNKKGSEDMGEGDSKD